MAKTTGKIKSNIRLIYMDDVLIGCQTDGNFNITNEVLEDSCKTGDDPPPRTYQAGLQEASLGGTMIVQFSDANQYSRVAAAAVGQTEHTWKVATPNADDPYWQVDGIVSNFDETFNFNNPLTAGFQVSPTGAAYLFNT